jgi:hypothetical protein
VGVLIGFGAQPVLRTPSDIDPPLVASEDGRGRGMTGANDSAVPGDGLSMQRAPNVFYTRCCSAAF